MLCVNLIQTILISLILALSLADNCKRKWKLYKDGYYRQLKKKSEGDADLSFLSRNNTVRLV